MHLYHSALLFCWNLSDSKPMKMLDLLQQNYLGGGI